MSTEIIVKPSTTMSGKIVETVGDVVLASLEATAQISLGQGLLKIADKFLWVVEKSAQWSLPIHEVEIEENGKTFGKIELVRPLPWIFFLPSLVMLRACRIGINVGAVILGYPKLQTTGMIKIIQKGRRRLRMIKSNGLRHMRHRKGLRNKEQELTEAKKSLIKSMLSTLSALSCLETSRRTPSPPPTRVYVQRSEPETTPTSGEQSTTESTSPQVHSKRKHCAVASFWDPTEEESTEVKLNRWGATYDDEHDPDFVPREEDLISSSSSSGEENDEDYVSETEITDLRIDNVLNPYVRGLDQIQHPHIPVPLTSVYEVISSQDSESEEESLPKAGPEDEAAPPAPAMNNVSTPNKAEETNLESLQPVDNRAEDDIELAQNEHRASVAAVNTPETDGENIVNFYSPIDSPINSPSDSIGDFQYPVADDANDSATEAKEEQKTTTPKIVTEPENQLENEALEANGKPTISGNTTDGQTATTNGTTTTNDEKRSNHTTGIPHYTGIHTELPQRKEK